MTMDDKILDLARFSQADSIVFSGRPEGMSVRASLNLDAEDSLPGPVVVVIPQRIISVNGSFFLGLFGQSVRNLGAVRFQSKYTFDCREKVKTDIARGIRHALEFSNPLD